MSILHENSFADFSLLFLDHHTYIKNKPVKWGLKSFMICDSLNGYIFNFEVYSGKEPQPVPELAATGNVVYRLLTSADLEKKDKLL